MACLGDPESPNGFPLGVPSVRASMHASESWHSGTNAPNQGSGTNAVPPEPMHQDANRFLSRRSWRPFPNPLPEHPGVLARTQARLTCRRPLPGDGAPGGAAASCSAALGRGKAAPPAACLATGGEGARVSCSAQPHFHPLLPREAGVGRRYACAVAARGGCCGGEEMEGGVGAQGRQVCEQARRYRYKGRKKVHCGLRGIRWLTGVKHVQDLTGGN